MMLLVLLTRSGSHSHLAANESASPRPHGCITASTGRSLRGSCLAVSDPIGGTDACSAHSCVLVSKYRVRRGSTVEAGGAVDCALSDYCRSGDSCRTTGVREEHGGGSRQRRREISRHHHYSRFQIHACC